MADEGQPAPAPEFEGERTRFFRYDFAVAVLSMFLVIDGLVWALFTIRALISPGEEDFGSTRDSVRHLLYALFGLVLPGLVGAWIHFRSGRRHDRELVAPEVRPRAGYFYGVAFIAYLFILAAVLWMLIEIVDLIIPPCEGPRQGVACYLSRDPVRRFVDAGLIILGAGPVWWWHLRRGRRLTAGAD